MTIKAHALLSLRIWLGSAPIRENKSHDELTSVAKMRTDDKSRKLAGMGGRRGVGRYTSAVYRLLRSPEYRSAVALRWRRPRNLFQVCNHTLADRYPRLFQLARQHVGDGPNVRLLSFGCSTGEEVFSLRTYFPQAAIKGIDINPRNIAVCDGRLRERPDPRICFEVADSVDQEPADAYDAVFCMAVFRHGNLADPRFDRCDDLIRFADFSRLVGGIAARIRPGGLLIIAHANFRFSDTAAAEAFELVHRTQSRETRTITPLFDRFDRRTDEVNHDAVVFRKREPAASPV